MSLRRGITLLLAALIAFGLFAYIYTYDTPLTTPAGRSAEERQQAVTAAGQSEERTLRIGWTAWADAEVVTTLVKTLLEQHLDYEVERVMTDIGIQYQAVADGDLDLMLMGWLPQTHRNYWEKVQHRVTNLGPIYTGRLGWVVPDYVPESELASLEDLRQDEVAKRLNRRIQGIDPGSGLMQSSEQAVKAYQLDDQYQLVAASGAAMTAVLDRAYRNQEWVVVTAWQPHWIFASYELRFLQDPRQILGGRERIHAIARQGFQQDYPPALTGFFTRFYLNDAELAELLLDSQEHDVDTAVRRYIDAHPKRIRYWLSGEIDE
ncbi:glycine betaine ABC transporter substrate-binding protein [Thiohalophilus thiocyanatoxydans]|uniref:Glycine betaine/proline transport system substrate-binding protein n=1 Tax=Thiohalophilus thiocyanatoxydans TaxID=381308 RepID=A0A4R8IR64_9GAMM|nr:glycine betaine ABC transporter substrate-binding protein [Thiohalophilus thiocyanatoxydans]TDX99978.1 glycine betaine/proline transport system substrate-binding protein [Thiohalophilus thiocyanatoxydans]